MKLRSRCSLRSIVLASLLWSLFAPGLAVAASDVSFSISAGVTASDEHYVREGITLAETYLRVAFGGEVSDNLVVNVRDIQYGDQPGLLAFASGDFLVVFAGSPVWQSLPPALRMQTVVHEYIHIFQDDVLLMGADTSPAWLIEGMADFFAYSALAGAGIASMDDADAYARWVVGFERDRLPALSSIESMSRFQSSDGAVYEVSQLAVTRLLGRQPEERARQYFELVDSGMPWRSAFPDAFGIELESFYRSFEAWVDDMVSPRRPPEAFSFVEPKRQEAEIVLVSVTTPIDQGAQLVVIGQTDPGVTCSFELRDAERERVERWPTVADRTGEVFWLASIPVDMLTGAATVVAACGGETDRISLAVRQPSTVESETPRAARRNVTEFVERAHPFGWVG